MGGFNQPAQSAPELLVQFISSAITFDGTSTQFGVGKFTILKPTTQFTYTANGGGRFEFSFPGLYEIASSIDITGAVNWPSAESNYGVSFSTVGGLVNQTSLWFRNPGAVASPDNAVVFSNITFVRVLTVLNPVFSVFVTSSSTPGHTGNTFGIARVRKLG